MIPPFADRLFLFAAALMACACHPSFASSSFLGRATFYGNGDGFTLNDGSCACHKQDVRSTWLNSRCEKGFCFDYIGSPQPTAGHGLVAAINTPGLNNTDQCGTCYAVTCVNGPTRGLPGSLLPDSGCISDKPVTVMITDSCPCDHANPDNQKWCCGDTAHLDLSHTAFGMIADHSKGVVDLRIQKLDSCPAAQHGVNTHTCDVFQKYHAAFKVAEFGRAVFGAAASCLFAGFVLMYLITAIWRRTCMQRCGTYSV
ncbi:hypothetical protein ABBQ32_004810 [Trebouxia sp. C0010 RCD-2024]